MDKLRIAGNAQFDYNRFKLAEIIPNAELAQLPHLLKRDKKKKTTKIYTKEIKNKRETNIAFYS